MNEWNPNEALLPEGWEEGQDLFAPQEPPQAEEAPETAAAEAAPEAQEARDYAAEVRQLQRLYPELREIPEEVAQLAAEGESMLTAYAVYQGRKAQQEAQALRAENKVLRQNASAAKRAPVRGLGGAGKERMSDFERGMEMM